ncbi:MAG: sigma-70 family RNA polymerase sigma factor [Paludibacteraceae bacterium]|nr:sigma-70 family RNA polymerase sigma factor [Paludibacteraceae bacterium]
MEVNNEFIKKNDRLVRVIVKQFKVVGEGKKDLIQEGRIGLIEAAKRYDPNMGVQFESYASWWVRKYVREYIIRYGQTVSLPFTNEDIFDHIIEDVDAVLYEEDGDPITFADCLPDDTDTDEEWVQQQQLDRLHKAIQGLPMREQEIIGQRYGIDCDAVPMKEVARRVGLSYDRVKKIHAKCVKKLKENLK